MDPAPTGPWGKRLPMNTQHYKRRAVGNKRAIWSRNTNDLIYEIYIKQEDLSPARPGTLNHLRQYRCCWELCCKICSSSFEIGKHDGNKNHAAPSLTAAARGSRSEWPDRRTLAVLTRCRLWVNGAKNHRPLCKEQANRDPSDEDVIRLGLP